MANVVDRMTERLLVDAGIGPGMRVVDVGCGPGFLTFLAAALVGSSGEVVGIDRDPRPLAAGRERARELGLANVTFSEGDFESIARDHGLFDAAIGRRVLMYQSDAAAALRQIASAVKPGGIVAFHEHDATMTPASRVPLPLHERAQSWMWKTVEREGADTRMGFGLAAALEEAGLVVDTVRAEAVVQTPRAKYPVAAILRAMMPRIVQHGVATAAEIDVDTIDARLHDELAAANATYVGEMVFTAWATKPG